MKGLTLPTYGGAAQEAPRCPPDSYLGAVTIEASVPWVRIAAPGPWCHAWSQLLRCLWEQPHKPFESRLSPLRNRAVSQTRASTVTSGFREVKHPSVQPSLEWKPVVASPLPKVHRAMRTEFRAAGARNWDRGALAMPFSLLLALAALWTVYRSPAAWQACPSRPGCFLSQCSRGGSGGSLGSGALASDGPWAGSPPCRP